MIYIKDWLFLPFNMIKMFFVKKPTKVYKELNKTISEKRKKTIPFIVIFSILRERSCGTN